MSTPDRQQILDAWETMDWLKSLIIPDADTIHGDKNRLIDAIQDLAEALPERPRPTMDELGWDKDQNFLAEADTFDGDGDKVVMLYGRNPDGSTTGIVTNAGIFYPRQLIPTGRRYKLVLDDGHPKCLETVEDYEGAPDGTIVADPGAVPWVKTGSVWCSAGRRKVADHAFMAEADGCPNVLRWGWGDDA